jgi:hypothetical protein
MGNEHLGKGWFLMDHTDYSASPVRRTSRE